jgi:hypothetical protein
VTGTLQRTILALAGAGAIAVAAAPAWAHHSFAMFDNAKTVTLKGTVKEFQWLNPHSWVLLDVKDASGADVEWSIEGKSPNALIRQGWKSSSLKPGDQAVVVIHPLKDGSVGGSLVSVSANGAKLDQGD